MGGALACALALPRPERERKDFECECKMVDVMSESDGGVSFAVGCSFAGCVDIEQSIELLRADLWVCMFALGLVLLFMCSFRQANGASMLVASWFVVISVFFLALMLCLTQVLCLSNAATGMSCVAVVFLSGELVMLSSEVSCVFEQCLLEKCVSAFLEKDVVAGMLHWWKRHVFCAS